MPPYIVVIDMRPNGGSALAVVPMDEDEAPAVFANEDEIENTMRGHILAAFPRLAVDLDDAR